MDEHAKTELKWKFYHLTVELNIIILLVAASVLVYFIIHSAFALLLIISMLVFAFLLSLHFTKKYRTTKAWLAEQAEKDKEKEKLPENGN